MFKRLYQSVDYSYRISKASVGFKPEDDESWFQCNVFVLSYIDWLSEHLSTSGIVFSLEVQNKLRELLQKGLK